MTVIRPCESAEIFDDPRGPSLIAEYAIECGNALIGRPAPNREIYAGMERNGMGQCFAAYEDTVLVGFAMVVSAVVPHYGLACANLESIYVTPDATCGGELMKTVEAYAKAIGCVTVFYVAPVKSRFARLLFLSDDIYLLTNYVFARRVTDGTG